MKKLFAILVAISLTFSGAVAANAADAYNPDIRQSQAPDATFVIGEEGSVDTYSLLHGNKGNGQTRSQFTCKSLADSACADADSFQAYSILGVCKSASDENCIVKLELSAGPQDSYHEAAYLKNISGITYSPAPSMNFIGASTTSLWESKEVPSASGTTSYSITVRVNSGTGKAGRTFNAESVVAAVVPYLQKDGNYVDSFAETVERNHLGVRGIGIGGHSTECAWNEVGHCGVAQDFATGTKVRLTVRLPKELSGWYRGRLKDPEFDAKPFSAKNNIVTIGAEPAVVPRFAFTKSIASLDQTEKDYANRQGMAGGWEGGFTTWARASDGPTFGFLDYFRKAVSDTSKGVNTLWNFGTINGNANGRCLNDSSKVLGIVTTNSMVYDGGVPAYKGGFLNYQVAGLHYMPNGTELAIGTYDMVIRSETARCLYGFSKAPLSATVSVISDQGAKTTATTVVSEKNGWLKLAAYGFTFSKKTIKVKITKKKK